MLFVNCKSEMNLLDEKKTHNKWCYLHPVVLNQNLRQLTIFALMPSRYNSSAVNLRTSEFTPGKCLEDHLFVLKWVPFQYLS